MLLHTLHMDCISYYSDFCIRYFLLDLCDSIFNSTFFILIIGSCGKCLAIEAKDYCDS